MESSLLIRLSPELRNQIYTSVFDSTYAVTLQTGTTQHPLTKTCRQLRKEALAMYYSLARFNAHLDDGPATPLARWLMGLGREKCLLLREVNVWDMHMLNATLHGQESTESMLEQRSMVDGVQNRFVLHPPGSWLLNQGWYLKDIVIALHALDLDLLNLALIERGDAEAKTPPSTTSHFAIVQKVVPGMLCIPGHDPREVHMATLLSRLGFDNDMSLEVIEGWRSAQSNRQGCQEVRIRRGRRDIFLYFESGHFRSIRQTFVPREEEMMF